MQDVFAAMAAALVNTVAEPPTGDVSIPEAEEVTVEPIWCSHCSVEVVSDEGDVCETCERSTVLCGCGCGHRQNDVGNPVRRVYISDTTYEFWTTVCISRKGTTTFCERMGCDNRMMNTQREVGGCLICPACIFGSGEYTQCDRCDEWHRTIATREDVCYRCLGLRLGRNGAIDDSSNSILLDVPPSPLPGLEGISIVTDPEKECDSSSKCCSHDLWKGGTIMTLREGEKISGKQYFPLFQEPPSGIVDGEYRLKVKEIIANNMEASCDWLDKEGSLIHADVILDMMESNRVMTEDGRYHKRLQKCFQEFCKSINLKLTKNDLSDIGKIVSECKPREEDNPEYLFMLYRDMNRNSRFYFNSGSCWWGGYSTSRCFVKAFGGMALMLYKRSVSDRNRVDLKGRSWLIPLAENFKKAKSPDEVVSWVVGNAYGDLDTEKTAKELCRTLGKDWSYKHISLRVKSSAGSNIYFNNGGRIQTFLVTKSDAGKELKPSQIVEVNWTKECRC